MVIKINPGPLLELCNECQKITFPQLFSRAYLKPWKIIEEMENFDIF